MTEKMRKKLENGREYRNLVSFELREAQDGGSLVEGYATVFDEPYLLYDFGDYVVNEQVDSKAFDGCDMSDVIFQYNHEGRVFARVSNGTLAVTPDSKGLKVSADLGGTEEGRKLYEEIKGGYTTKMSFGFIVGEDKVEKTNDRESGKTTVLRTIMKITKLYDVSAVSIPANDATEISARNFGDGVVKEIESERLARAKEAEEKRAECLELLKPMEPIKDYD